MGVHAVAGVQVDLGQAEHLHAAGKFLGFLRRDGLRENRIGAGGAAVEVVQRIGTAVGIDGKLTGGDILGDGNHDAAQRIMRRAEYGGSRTGDTYVRISLAAQDVRNAGILLGLCVDGHVHQRTGKGGVIAVNLNVDKGHAEHGLVAEGEQFKAQILAAFFHGDGCFGAALETDGQHAVFKGTAAGGMLDPVGIRQNGTGRGSKKFGAVYAVGEGQILSVLADAVIKPAGLKVNHQNTLHKRIV